jgi:hypothetical protein
MTISQRGLVQGVLCDVVCTGRFYDFLEKRSSRVLKKSFVHGTSKNEAESKRAQF